MTKIAVFPPVLGVRQGTIDASDLLRSQGHDVHVIDYLDGRTYGEYGPAMSDAWEEIGQSELMRRGLEGVADLQTDSSPSASRWAAFSQDMWPLGALCRQWS
jgi:hypothetical protein